MKSINIRGRFGASYMGALPGKQGKNMPFGEPVAAMQQVETERLAPYLHPTG
jgi:hypothetical protein